MSDIKNNNAADGEPEETIEDGAVANKYSVASDVANNAIKTLIEEMSAGKKIVDLCKRGDQLLVEGLAKSYASKKNVEKGIAFPTCISVNNIAGHISPLDGDATVLQDGDLVKIDLGVHIGGHIAVTAHTTIVGSSVMNVTTGKKADVICAAYIAAEIALRLMRPGNKNSDITKAIAKVAEEFHVNPLEGVLSHQLKRFVIDGAKVIMNKSTPEQVGHEETIEPYEVYALDIVMSTGDGKAKELDEKATTVFKRAVDTTYSLKLKTARTLLNDINRNHPALPFTLRSLPDLRARFGMTELLQHSLVHSYPILHEKSGEYIAQFKFTVLVTPSSIKKLTNLPLPFVQSQYALTDPELKELQTASTNSKKRKNTTDKSEKKAGTETPSTVTPMDTQ